MRKTSGGSPIEGCSVGKMPWLGRILGVRCLVVRDRTGPGMTAVMVVKSRATRPEE